MMQVCRGITWNVHAALVQARWCLVLQDAFYNGVLVTCRAINHGCENPPMAVKILKPNLLFSIAMFHCQTVHIILCFLYM